MSRKRWPYFFFFLGLIFIGAVLGAYLFFRQKTPEQILSSPVIKKTIQNRLRTEPELIELFPRLLGFQQPQTYLILFQNNTEIRPGGGFLGTYSVVRVSHGQMEVLALEGTELLDQRSPANFRPMPPAILQQKLGVDRWYFRDSNWSPDFSENIKKALEFYAAEGGVAAGEIDGVIAFTPAVLRELLRISGPITVEGVTFDANNAVEQLEKEVEQNWLKKGVAKAERKRIIDPFFRKILERVGLDAFLHPEKYLSLIETLGGQKHILASFTDPELKKFVVKKQWDGRVKETTGDFLLWVDANLAALKTDHAIRRTLFYSFAPTLSESITASVKMKYEHRGVIDWRTSRYHTYARVFVPAGSKMVEANSIDKQGKKTRLDNVDSGNELGKQWFGVFFTVEPQETKELEFVYALPSSIMEIIKTKKYSLLAQKQAGLENIALTLNLNFGTNIQSATPAEEKKEWGDGVYRWSGGFEKDVNFEVGF